MPCVQIDVNRTKPFEYLVFLCSFYTHCDFYPAYFYSFYSFSPRCQVNKSHQDKQVSDSDRRTWRTNAMTEPGIGKKTKILHANGHRQHISSTVDDQFLSPTSWSNYTLRSQISYSVVFMRVAVTFSTIFKGKDENSQNKNRHTHTSTYSHGKWEKGWTQNKCGNISFMQTWICWSRQ